jgi:hypothetical protein
MKNRKRIDKMAWTLEQQTAPYGMMAAEQQVYYDTLEERCKHLEKTINVTSSLLRVVVKDFGHSSLKPILGSVIERVNSIAAFVETASSTGQIPNHEEER